MAALGALLIVGVLAACVGLALLHSKLVYHNYRCAFAHCRIIQVQH